jgi:ferredoxin
MKVVVDYDLCEGNRKCEMAAPEVFEVPEDQAIIKNEHPAEELRSKVERAARVCPRLAISIQEE